MALGTGENKVMAANLVWQNKNHAMALAAWLSSQTTMA
jgi:hypothetical protein